MEQTVLGWITEYGEIALIGLLALGVFGLPVPDETLLTLAGVLVRRGELRFGVTLSSAVLGSSTGITLSYVVGRWLGSSVLARYGRFVHISTHTLDRVHRWFDYVGKWTLTFGYFLPGVRHLTAIAAGSSGLAFGVFGLFAYSGSVLWCSSFIVLGYYVGDRWEAVADALRRHLAVAAAILCTGAAIYLLMRRQARRPG